MSRQKMPDLKSLGQNSKKKSDTKEPLLKNATAPAGEKKSQPKSQPKSPRKPSIKKSKQKKSGFEKNAPQEKVEQEKVEAAKADTFGYSSLAKQTLDLWRDQLSNFLNNPEAMTDFNKAAEPAATLLSPMFTPFLTRGMDIWLMMLEQFSKVANSNSFDAAGGSHDTRNTANAKAQQPNNAAHRSEAASALSGASAYAVAELASRVAELEKRFAEFEAGAKPAKKSAGKKKPNLAPLAAVKEVRQKRG